MSVKLLLVGCGNMGFAMLDGWVRSGKLVPGEVFAIEPNEALRERAAKLGVAVAASADDVPAGIDPTVVIFAVKPQMMHDVVPAYRRFTDKAAFVSIAAGTGVAALESLLGSDVPIIRCMPNTPAAIGRGMMVVYANGSVSAETKAFVSELLSASGVRLPLHRMPCGGRREGGPAGGRGEAARHADGLRCRQPCPRKRRGTGTAARAGDQPQRHDGGGTRRADGRGSPEVAGGGCRGSRSCAR